jgi:hypothetical protein
VTEERLELGEDELHGTLLPKLRGRVFHVTTEHGYAAIKADGFVRSNENQCFELTTSQSAVSYFRKNGCISLIDLRDISDEDLEWGLRKYYFLNPFSTDVAVFLILDSSCHGQLISWTISKGEGFKAMIVPEFETGFRGLLPLALIRSVVHCRVARKPDPVTAWLRQIEDDR